MTKDEIEELKQLAEIRKMIPEGAIIGQFNAPGSISIGKIERVENLFPGSIDDLKNKIANKKAGKTDDGTLVEELLPFFYGNREKTIEFISSIKGQKPIVVTNLVKQLIAEKTISGLSAGKHLHSVIQKYGLYKPTLSNWNKRLK